MSIIGEGSYGCVIRPGKLCGNQATSSDDLVAKVFFDQRDYRQESQLIDITKKIDPKGNFTVKTYEKCIINNDLYTELKNCKGYQQRLQKSSKSLSTLSKSHHPNNMFLSQIVYEYGGISLYSIANHNLKYNYITFEDIFKSLNSIFKGLITLNHPNISITHQDITYNNIVYNSKKGKSFLIDFGLAEESKRVFLYANSHRLEHTYDYYPPEYKLMSKYYLDFNTNFVDFKKYIKKYKDITKTYRDDIKNDDLDDIMSSTENYIKCITPMLLDFYSKTNDKSMKHIISIIVHQHFRPNIINMIKTLYGNIEHVEYSSDMFSILRSYAQRVDVYSLGVTIFKVWARMYKNNRVVIKDEKFIKELLELLYNMINTNMFERYNAEEAYKAYKNCCITLNASITKSERKSYETTNVSKSVKSRRTKTI